MSDRILIKDLLVRIIIGVNDDERRSRQDVLINVVMEVDTLPAGVSDNIDDSVNYRTVAKRIIQLAEHSRYYLVERLAHELAGLCLEDPRVQRVTLQVEKPNALRFAESVGVEVTRAQPRIVQRNLAYIGLGSNIEPEQHLRNAVARLRGQFTIWAVSPVYESPAVGSSGQARYLNAVLLLETSLLPHELLQRLKQVEDELGRVREADKFAARSIDLDLVLYNEAVLDIEGHKIPDPTILTYAHLARPLADIAPGVMHPVKHQPMAEIAASLDSSALTPRPDIKL
ncbi:MAG: 2-amino-4-hydroxy-6-hydroxymethyldihydropteridine diphosphokinase [Chloroflexi bacterium]|nr:2-amino-4-hydroxy-6-hydroxymethyldihydropteridine diphosphokinase [Chloroflexota bacterium]